MIRALLLILAIQSAAQAMPQENISDALSHAQALYYQARFSDSIQLLTRVNDVLRTKPDMLPERISTKLQLALAHIGLNQTREAKAFLLELYALDPDYVIDPKQFSPKVIELASSAKMEHGKIRCQSAMFDARRHLESGNSASLVSLIDSTKSKCSNLTTLEPEAAELAYKTGLAAYRRNEFQTALQNFKTAVRLAPAHELATQYIELTQNKLQIAEDRMLLQWQKNFESGQLKQAAADYRQITAGGSNPLMASHIQTEYRKALTGLVETWNRVCPSGDEAALNEIRGQISELIPTPTFGEDIRGRMAGNCAKPVVPKEPEPLIAAAATPAVVPTPDKALNEPVKPAAGPTCFAMEPQFALARLKTKVDPVFPRETRSYLQNAVVTVRVKMRIDEIGNVISADAQGSNALINASVKSAVEMWKFNPTRDTTGLRCVDTEIPINIGIR